MLIVLSLIYKSNRVKCWFPWKSRETHWRRDEESHHRNSYLLNYCWISFLLSNSNLPVIKPIMFKTVTHLNDTVRLVAVNYIIHLLANVSAIVTPIVAIVLLNPVMKNMLKSVCVCVCVCTCVTLWDVVFRLVWWMIDISSLWGYGSFSRNGDTHLTSPFCCELCQQLQSHSHEAEWCLSLRLPYPALSPQLKQR